MNMRSLLILGACCCFVHIVRVDAQPSAAAASSDTTIGIAVGVTGAVLLLIAAGAFWYFRWRTEQQKQLDVSQQAQWAPPPMSARFGDDRINSLSGMQSAVQDPLAPAPMPPLPPLDATGHTVKSSKKRRTMVGQYEMLPQDQQRQQQQMQWGGSVAQPPQMQQQQWGGSVAGMPPSPVQAMGRGTFIKGVAPLVYDAVDSGQPHEAYNALSLKPHSQPVLSPRDHGDTRQQRSAPDLTYQPVAQQQPLKYVELGPEKQLRYGGLAPEQPAPQAELWADEMDSVPNTPMRYGDLGAESGIHPTYGELAHRDSQPQQYGELGPETQLRYGELRPEVDGEREPQTYGEMPLRPSDHHGEEREVEAYLQVPEIDVGGGELYDQVPTRKMVASPGGRSKNRAMGGNNQFR